MATPSPDLELPAIAPGDNSRLTRWWAPVRAEVTTPGPFDLDGALPPGLDGRLIWLGPNPVVVPDPDAYTPLDGDGMLHSLELREGRPVEQRARLIITRHLVELLHARGPEGPLSAAGPYANRSLIHLAHRLVALDGQGLGYRVTPDLRTACVEDFDAMLTSPMGAHVVVDPGSGVAHFLGTDPAGPPWLRLHRLEPDGTLSVSRDLDVEHFAAEPALGRTESTIVVCESSLASAPLRGDDDVLGPLSFDPDRPARVGLFEVGLDAATLGWATSDPGHVNDVLSCQPVEIGIRAAVWRSSPSRIADASWRPPLDEGYLEVLEVNDIGWSVSVNRFDDLALGGIAGDPLTAMHQRRHLYAVTKRRSGAKGAQLVKYDLATGTAHRRAVPEHLVADRPLFVRDPEGRHDEEGWVVVNCFDRAQGATVLMILDATDFDGSPASMVTLPSRIPFGARGLFLAPTDLR